MVPLPSCIRDIVQISSLSRDASRGCIYFREVGSKSLRGRGAEVLMYSVQFPVLVQGVWHVLRVPGVNQEIVVELQLLPPGHVCFEILLDRHG